MYNIDEVSYDDVANMQHYLGKLVFSKDKYYDKEDFIFLKSWYDGETIIYPIALEEIKGIFFEELYKKAQREPVVLEFYADSDENNKLYNIKGLIVYGA